MPVLDKKLLLSDIEAKLNDYIPANTVKQILADAGEILTRYEVMILPSDNPEDDESKQLIKLFLDAKDIEGKSKQTLAHYQYVLTRLHEGTRTPLKKVTVYHIRQYMMAEKERGISMTTIKGNCWVYTGFYSWLHAEGLIPMNPTVNIGTIKAKPEEEPPFSGEEIQLLKEACKNEQQSALIHFLLATGCRVGEVCSVNRSDIDFQNLCLKVHGKGDKYRTVYIDNVTAMMLKRYLKTRKDIDPALFIGIRGNRFTPHGIREMLNTIGDRAHVPNVHPHRFRHTFATGLIDRGMEIQEVSALLGHAKLDTTMTYVHLNQRNTENSYRKFAVM